MAEPSYEVYQDKANRYRWRLRSANGQVVSSSNEDFASKANAQRAARGAKKTSAAAQVKTASPRAAAKKPAAKKPAAKKPAAKKPAAKRPAARGATPKRSTGTRSTKRK